MPTEPPLTVDFLQEDAPSLILPNLPRLTSHQSGWNGVHLAYHQQPAWELPEMASDQHIIYIPAANQRSTVEILVEKQLRIVTFDTDEFSNGCSGILPANLPYKLCWDIEVEFLHLYLEPTFLAHIAHESVNPDRVELSLELKLFDPLIYHLGLALKADLEVDGMGNGFYADSLATALAAHLLQHYATRKYILREYEDGLSSQKLQQAIAYIQEHLGENPSLATIAHEVDMSQYYFCRLFKQSTGITPHQYLIQQRVERAKRLLRQPELTVTEVAMMCGFAHPSHFAKYFRQQTGVPPRQFRRL